MAGSEEVGQKYAIGRRGWDGYSYGPYDTLEEAVNNAQPMAGDVMFLVPSRTVIFEWNPEERSWDVPAGGGVKGEKRRKRKPKEDKREQQYVKAELHITFYRVPCRQCGTDKVFFESRYEFAEGRHNEPRIMQAAIGIIEDDNSLEELRDAFYDLLKSIVS